MKKYAIIGTTLIDILFDNQQKLDQYCNKGNILTNIGGSMCNVVRTLKRLGLEVPFYTVLGNDFYKDKIIADFKQEGIDLHASLVDQPTPVFIQLNDTIRACSMNSHFRFHEFNEKVDLLITDNENCIQGNTIFSGSIPSFNHLKGLIVNKMEAKEYGKDLNQAILDLHKRCEFVIITLADQGYMWAYQNEIHHKTIYASKQGNFIGSGDAFLAGFLFKYLDDQPFEDCLLFAEKVAKDYINQ